MTHVPEPGTSQPGEASIIPSPKWAPSLHPRPREGGLRDPDAPRQGQMPHLPCPASLLAHQFASGVGGTNLLIPPELGPGSGVLRDLRSGGPPVRRR